MKTLARMSLLFVIALVSVSAYLRLHNSGIGCANWPDCYGMIGVPAEESPSVVSTYERLAMEAQQPLFWATPVHRLVASVLGLLVMVMAFESVRQRKDRTLSIALLGLTAFLAWLGIYSGGLHSPAVVMGNLSGGFAMLGMLGWMVFRDTRPRAKVSGRVRGWIVSALLLLCLQIAIGGLTSANFAASACLTLPDCHGTWFPGRDLATAFDLSRQIGIDATGLALGGPEQADIHKLHRLVAMLTLATVVIAGLLASKARLGATAIAVIAIATTEFLVGIAAILTDLPIGIAVAHNWLAAILLLSLLRLLALCRDRQV